MPLYALILTACAGPKSADDSVAHAATVADELTALATNCIPVAGTSEFATDEGRDPTIPVCQLSGAVAWTADMDVDCDGAETTKCNATTDPTWSNDTSILASDDSKIDASMVPYVVVPLASGMDGCTSDTGFDYRAAGIGLGAVAVVIYQQQIQYGAFVDEGPCTIIGEASYAMNARLGFNPDPANGGHEESDVTYIVFTGTDAVAAKVEDVAGVETLGYQLVEERFGIVN